MEAEQFLKENYNQLYHLLKQDETGFDFMEDYANQSKWISVETMPERDKVYQNATVDVLGYDSEQEKVMQCFYDYSTSDWLAINGESLDITHWQPLPTFNEK